MRKYTVAVFDAYETQVVVAVVRSWEEAYFVAQCLREALGKIEEGGVATMVTVWVVEHDDCPSPAECTTKEPHCDYELVYEAF